MTRMLLSDHVCATLGCQLRTVLPWTVLHGLTLLYHISETCLSISMSLGVYMPRRLPVRFSADC